ncbi:MAG TPA: hypothetical protein VKT17_06795, partial [Acidobacteriota bacterium]|nr:hypothetical protein [Acidobacteriota bacterium]
MKGRVDQKRADGSFPMSEYAERPTTGERLRLFAILPFFFKSAALLFALGAAPIPQGRSLPDVPAALKDKLTVYLETEGRSPEDYVLSKFRDHDIVLLGEHHFIKHDVEFVQSLLPFLYENGIRDLGIEFGCHELQGQADALVTAETYDEGLARRLMFQWASYWPYVEYMELYRKAWELNKSLPEGAPRFRIVGLDYRIRWDLVTEDMTPEAWKSVFFKGPRDEHMART